MQSKLSQAKHRIGSARRVRTVNPYNGKKAKYRLSTAMRGARHRVGSSGYTGGTSNSFGYSNTSNHYGNLPKYRLSTAMKGAKHRVSGEIGNIIVNYTPDVYDSPKGNQDYATHSTAKLIGNGFMTARTGYRGIKTLQRFTWKARRNHYDKKAGSKYVKKSAKMSRNLKYSSGLNPAQSTKMMINNQTRKAVNKVANSEDKATQITGKAMRLSINTIKYRKQWAKSIRTISSLVKALIGSVVGFITSLPMVIISAIASIPVMIIVIIITVIISLMSSYNPTFFGMEALFNYQNDLETEFGINIDVVELSCVADALEWNRDIDYRKVERLVAYYYIDSPSISAYKDRDSKYYCANPKDAKKTDFDTGLKRVFSKQNPAKSLNNNDKWGIRDDIPNDSLNYSNLKSINRHVIEFYREYKNMKTGNDSNNTELRAYYGTNEKINERIAFAKSRYTTNLGWFSIYGTPNELPDSEILANGTYSQKAVELGKGKLGCRYWWAKQGPTYFDCSGFVWWCYNTAGVNFARGTAQSYSKLGVEVPKDISQLKEGDLILISWKGGKISHVVMYIGNNQIIGANGGGSNTHGDNPKACVSIKNISYCWNKTVSIRRLAE